MRQVTRIVLLAFVLQIASPFLVLAQTPTRAAVPKAAEFEKELKQFDAFVERQMKFDKTPGLTIGFIKDGFVWTKGYGFADLENKLPAKH
jgi:CubicO group peptidase (beta-lactamase class C family)